MNQVESIDEFGHIAIGQYFYVCEGPLASHEAGFWHKISDASANWLRRDPQGRIHITGSALFATEMKVRVFQP